jgi:hypothetical protein
MKRGSVLAAIACLATSACVSPLVTPNPPSWQVKAEHVHDWQAMAARAVAKLPRTVANNERPAVYVDPGPPTMPFAAAYRKYLEQALYEANYPVLSTPGGAQIVLHFDVQWLYYGHGNQKPIADYASLYTMAGLILGQTRNISSIDTGLGAAALVGPVADFLLAMNDTTRAEVILTTKIEDNGRYHYLGSENFYVQPADLVFYLAPPEPLDMRVVPLQVSNGGAVR